ncbi:MAG: hypothetical protein Kow0079_11440 [Vicingaceae bacterium]
MKKTILLLFLISSFAIVKSQNQRFLKTYQVREGSQYDFINVKGATSSPMYPGSIFVTFYQNDYNESSASHQGLMILDTAGNLIKTISYFANNTASNNSYYNQSVFVDPNGDIFLSGNVTGQANWEADGVIMKVDTGNNIWFAKKIGSMDGSSLNDDDAGITVAKTLNIASNPPLYVTGSVDQYAGSITDKQIPFIAKVDKSNGNVSNYLEVETNSSIPYALYNLPSGNISVWADEIGSTSLLRDVWLLFDSTLNLLSAPISFEYANYNFISSIRTSILTSDFNQVNAGICQDSTGKYQVYCYSITSTGSINWSKVYSFDAGLLPTSITKGGVTSIVEQDSSLYILINAAVAIIPYNDFLLMKVNKNTGEILWVKSQATNYKGQASVYAMNAHSLIIENNSLYIIGDYTKYGPDNSVFMIKADLNGDWDKNCYDDRYFGNVTAIDANIINTNLPFSYDVTYYTSVFGPQAILFPDTMAEEVKAPVASAVVPNALCKNSVLSITDQSSYNYSWNYTYKDCGSWYNGSYFDLAPGTTHNNNSLYCFGNDTIVFYAYDVDDNWNNEALCFDSAVYIVSVASLTANIGFTYSTAGNAIQFNDTTTGTIQWYWDFGDGSNSTSQNPLHTYAGNGIYNVCLTAWTPCDSNTVCQTITITGIENVTMDNQLKIYPNPANKFLHIENLPLNAIITLYNLTGEKVFSTKAVENTKTIPLNKLSSGIYVIEINNDNYIHKEKLIIQNN